MGKTKPKTQKKAREVVEKVSETKTKSTGLNLRRYVNKQRTLVFSGRGISHRDRHLIQDIRDLLPHSKKDNKLDSKSKLSFINEICDMKNCNNCIFFESRKKKDLYMWLARAPEGPSIKFLVQNVHTMSEVKMTGNCLKGSRPILVFDKNFDLKPHYRLLKEQMTQIFGSPKAHPKTKPFVDHVFSFFVLDDRIWFRNYQIVYQVDQVKQTTKDPALVEIGPRLVLNPIRMFSGSMGGPTLWANPNYISPNIARQATKRQRASSYQNRLDARDARREHLEANPLPHDPLSSDMIFNQEENEDDSD